MKLKIFACGGAGLNIAKPLAKVSGKPSAGFADLETVFIDTSKSNIDDVIPRDQIYLVDDLDGSGKRRATNYNALSECANEILHTHRPADINVVIHSGGGGSGSVIGPLLVSEMLSRDQLVVVVMVGSTSSRIETENTKKTMGSYEVISQKRQLPVNVVYRENSLNRSRSDIDGEVSSILMLMTAFFSGQNRELDTEDVTNFLKYHRVTSYQPKLSALDFFSRDIVLPKGQALVSLLTLVSDGTPSEVSHLTEYQGVGYLNETAAKAINLPLPLHATVVAGFFNQQMALLDKKLGDFVEARSVVVEKSIVDKNASSTDEGLIL